MSPYSQKELIRKEKERKYTVDENETDSDFLNVSIVTNEFLNSYSSFPPSSFFSPIHINPYYFIHQSDNPFHQLFNHLYMIVFPSPFIFPNLIDWLKF